jgi:hypothetical protein
MQLIIFALFLKATLADYLFAAIYENTASAPKAVTFKQPTNGSCTQSLADSFATTNAKDFSSKWTPKGECTPDPIEKTKSLYNGKASYLLDVTYQNPDCSGTVTEGNALIGDASCISTNTAEEGSTKVTISGDKVSVDIFSDQACGGKSVLSSDAKAAELATCSNGEKTFVTQKDGSSPKPGSSQTNESGASKATSIWSLVILGAVLLMH